MNIGYPFPARRRLQVFPFDPMIDRGGRTVSVDLPYEKLDAGPAGRLVEVVDYDGSQECFYTPVDLDAPPVLAEDGLAPNESDPRFHQQMVYAVSMAVLERFERGLGRAFRWRGDQRLRIYPHAFERRNACFDPDFDKHGALLFGYFTADEDDPGANIPGQVVYTCLSHAIIAHETTHAVLHRLRPQYAEPTNPDVLAIHEGLSDIVAMLLPFTYSEVVRGEISRTRGSLGAAADLASGTALLEMAAQYGFATGKQGALRSGIAEPDPTALAKKTRAHDRGTVLAQAIIAAFLKSYRSQANASIRLATSGSGVLAPGALHPDLVRSLAKAAAKSAERLLNMVIRAIDYLPPVDPTFGDYLRAIVTADADLFPTDAAHLRADLIECFRERGIYPTGAVSLAERSIRIDLADPDDFDGTLPVDSDFLVESVREFERRSPTIMASSDEYDPYDHVETTNALSESAQPETARRYASRLHDWATVNAEALGLTGEPAIQVAGFHVAQRLDDDGYIRSILTVQFMQSEPKSKRDKNLGGLRKRGGTTVIADAAGNVRYTINRPFPEEGGPRLQALERQVANLEHDEPSLAWDRSAERILHAYNLRGIDNGRRYA